MSLLPRSAPALLAAGAIAVGAGCGDNETTADIDELSACPSDVDALPNHAIGRMPAGLDEVADDADGALKIIGVSGDALTGTNQDIRIVAEGSTEGASAAADSYEAAGSAGTVEQYGTVVVASLHPLSDEERSAIEACLDEQGVG